MRQPHIERVASGARAGFTLIELLLVMVILSILAAVVVPKFVGQSERARITAAHTDISTLEGALDLFELDAGRYPTTEEGLNALMVQPAGVQEWHGAYIKRSMPLDPWKHQYVYKCPGSHNTDSYDLYSLGPTGQEGANDIIGNWSDTTTP
jgi:general secretion pathway protein G